MTTHSVPEAAEILQVTDKTIRNYIDRGFLKPDKWNGSWRIPRSEISELFWNKFGTRLDAETENRVSGTDQIMVQKSDFEEQQRELGKLAALELSETALRTENRDLVDKNAQLEASAASGWTQARALQDELDRLRQELTETNANAQKAIQDSEWLRRELDEMRLAQENSNQIQRRLKEENQRLSEQLVQKSLGL